MVVDRDILNDLIIRLGGETSTLSKAAGSVSARAGFLKLKWEGFEPGKLGMFEGLELLALGIQGKCLLWKVLKEVGSDLPEWSSYRFSELEREAVEQRDQVEEFRMTAGRNSLLSFKHPD